MKHCYSLFTLIIFVCFIITGCATVPKTPLTEAASKGDSITVQKLIKNGSDINEADSSGYTPLLMAMYEGKPDIAKVLINMGANINKPDNIYGYTPLMTAAIYGYTELTDLLISKGADVNAKAVDGSTSLIQAAMYGNYDIAKKLIENNANVFAIDSSGYRALDYARFAQRPIKRVFKSTANVKKTELLIKMLRESEDNCLKIGFAGSENQGIGKLISIIRTVSGCMTPEIDYTVYVNQDKNTNAFVNISGQITFTSGAMEKWDDETLTFIAAHEIAHDKLGHVAKKMAVSYTTTGAFIIAGAFVPGIGVLNHVVNPAITRNYSKTQEYEADKMASDYCLKCFNMTKEKQLAIIDRLKNTSKNDGGGFWSTHPSWDDRGKNIGK